jgi:predicted acylesterase/phospholipase RssA
MQAIDSGSDNEQATDITLPKDMILCLSGGGLRATFFHLGVIRALKEAQLLDGRLMDVISVSGGSITAAHLVLNWLKYTGSDEEYVEVETQLLSLRHWDLRGRAVRRSILTSPFTLVASFFGLSDKYLLRRIEHLRNDYDRFLKRQQFSTLQNDVNAKNKPVLHLMATSFATGEPCTFSSNIYQFSLLKTPLNTSDISIATAVAASSAFPPVFS